MPERGFSDPEFLRLWPKQSNNKYDSEENEAAKNSGIIINSSTDATVSRLGISWYLVMFTP